MGLIADDLLKNRFWRLDFIETMFLNEGSGLGDKKLFDSQVKLLNTLNGGYKKNLIVKPREVGATTALAMDSALKIALDGKKICYVSPTGQLSKIFCDLVEKYLKILEDYFGDSIFGRNQHDFIGCSTNGGLLKVVDNYTQVVGWRFDDYIFDEFALVEGAVEEYYYILKSGDESATVTVISTPTDTSTHFFTIASNGQNGFHKTKLNWYDCPYLSGDGIAFGVNGSASSKRVDSLRKLNPQMGGDTFKQEFNGWFTNTDKEDAVGSSGDDYISSKIWEDCQIPFPVRPLTTGYECDTIQEDVYNRHDNFDSNFKSIFLLDTQMINQQIEEVIALATKTFPQFFGKNRSLIIPTNSEPKLILINEKTGIVSAFDL